MVLTGLFWPASTRLQAVLGVLWGLIIGEIGFFLICRMAASLKPGMAEKQAKQKGALQYTGRYFLYALCLFAGAWAGLSPIAMLIGILCSKLALAGVSLAGRKDTR